MQFSRIRPIKFTGVVLSALMLAAVFAYLKPNDLLASLGQFPADLLIMAVVLIAVNQATVIYRYRRILYHFGFDVPAGPVYKASVLGNLASLVIIPLMGQMIGRQAILRAVGVTPVENAIIVAYERILVAAVSAGCAVLGGIYLLGRGAFEHIANLPFIEIGLILALALGLNLWIGITKFERRHFAIILKWRNVWRIVELLGITVVSLLAMLSSFVLLFHAVAPNLDLLTLYAMAAVVSFAASMPLSFGGWGLREIAAIYVLGVMGISAQLALSASIMCGLLSILVVVLMAAPALAPHAKAWSIPQGGRSASVRLDMETASESIERTSAWLLAVAVALLIFFQIFVSLGGETVNLNLADPFAMLALSVLGLDFLIYKKVPAWNVPKLNVYLLIMWAALGAGLLIAAFRFGVTSWAMGKVMGWLVLLGYAAAGYIAVSYYRMLGFRRIVEMMVLVLCAGLVVFAAIRPFQYLGLPGFLHESVGFQAYSGNRNALAFQILAVLSVYLPLLGQDFRLARERSRAYRGPPVWLGICAVGILVGSLLLTASRSGYIALALLLSAAVVLRAIDWRNMTMGVIIGVLVWWGLDHLPEFYAAVERFVASIGSDGAGAGGASKLRLQAVGGTFSYDASDRGRWELGVASVKLWWSYPLFGSGLGYFLSISAESLGFRSIIHNTLMWLLAELGIVGTIPFIVAFVAILRSALRHRSDIIRSNGILLLLLAFAVMSVFHEMLYQRIFWFCLGTLLASSVIDGRTHSRP